MMMVVVGNTLGGGGVFFRMVERGLGANGELLVLTLVADRRQSPSVGRSKNLRRTHLRCLDAASLGCMYRNDERDSASCILSGTC